MKEMNSLGLSILIRDIFSQKSPEAIANETRHGNRSTLAHIPSDALVRNRVLLLDTTKPVDIYDEINERLLNCLVKRMQRKIVKEASAKHRNGKQRGVGKQAAQVFHLLCQQHNDTEISHTLKLSRQRIGQIKELLRTLPSVKKLYKELKGEYSGLKW